MLKLSSIYIPKEKIEAKFSRSSGPGGQHVNKTNSKAEIRFNVEQADWLEDRVKKCLREKYSNFINKDNELIITS